MRLQRGFVGNLSIKYLKQKHAKVVHANVEMMKFGRIEQLLKISKEIGVPSEHIYNLILQVKKISYFLCHTCDSYTLKYCAIQIPI